MTVRVMQTQVGTLVEWDRTDPPSASGKLYELAPGHEVSEGEVAIEGEPSYGATFTAKLVETEPEAPRRG